MVATSGEGASPLKRRTDVRPPAKTGGRTVCVNELDRLPDASYSWWNVTTARLFNRRMSLPLTMIHANKISDGLQGIRLGIGIFASAAVFI